MRRYRFLKKTNIYEILNKLRASFLAAKDGVEVEEIIMGLLTRDERIKLGRRILIAEMITDGIPYDQIAKHLKVGKTTVMLVAGKMQKHPNCFKLIHNREEKVEKTYKQQAYQKTGGSKMVYKKKEHTGFSRNLVKR